MAGYPDCPRHDNVRGPSPLRPTCEGKFGLVKRHRYAYGGYPDLDALFEQQARERDPAKREALLHRIQQLTVERAMFAPLMDFRQLIGIGPKVAEHAINLMPVYAFPSWEDVRVK